MGGVTQVVTVVLLELWVVHPVIGVVEAASAQLQPSLAVVEVDTGHLLATVSLFLPFKRCAVQPIRFEGGDFSCIGEVGIDLPGGVEGGEREIAGSQHGCRTTEVAALGGGEVTLGLLCAPYHLITAPALAHPVVVVQDQPLAKGKTVVAQDQSPELSEVTKQQVQSVVIVSPWVAAPKEGLPGILLGGEARLQLVAVTEGVA